LWSLSWNGYRSLLSSVLWHRGGIDTPPSTPSAKCLRVRRAYKTNRNHAASRVPRTTRVKKRTMVFINKTLSTETTYQQDLINRDLLSTSLIVGKVGSGMWCDKFNSTFDVIFFLEKQKSSQIFIVWHTVTGETIGTHIIRESGLSLCVWGPIIQSNPYCICQFPNLINYTQQTLFYQQLVDIRMVLSTVGW
jgi:hypothetical protein